MKLRGSGCFYKVYDLVHIVLFRLSHIQKDHAIFIINTFAFSSSEVTAQGDLASYETQLQPPALLLIYISIHSTKKGIKRIVDISPILSRRLEETAPQLLRKLNACFHRDLPVDTTIQFIPHQTNRN